MNNKGNQKSINTNIASIHSLEQLTNAVDVLSTVQELSGNSEDATTPEIELIIEAIKIRAESVFYIFSAIDELAGELCDGEPEGIAIYQRFGNILQPINEKNLITTSEAIEELTRRKINNVFTGTIERNFLSVERRFTTEHGGYDLITEKSQLQAEEISELNKEGICVTVLKRLE